MKDSSDEYNQALHKAMVLLQYNDRTTHELRERLLKEKYTEDTVDDVITYLTEDGLINDRRYAGYYVTCYISKKSISTIRRKLEEKGIDEDIIDEALSVADDTRALEEALRKQLVRRGISDISEADYVTGRKIADALYRQGYSASKIREVLSNGG